MPSHTADDLADAAWEMADGSIAPSERLKQVIEAAKAVGGSLASLTVLDNDPYRQWTPARRRDGEWFAEAIDALGIVGRIHLRGLHYVFLGRTRPDGTPHPNTLKGWGWLEDAAKAARWLGLVPFEKIVDARNAEPVVRLASAGDEPGAVWLSPASEPCPSAIELPDIDIYVPVFDMLPGFSLTGFKRAQPYRIVLIGEKVSLEHVLYPVAEEYDADLYLPTGDISDTHIHRITADAADDGRPLRVLYFADCDPGGWNMGIAVARKLQALRDLYFPGLEFQLRRVALTPDQVREHGLPSNPIKSGDPRSRAWKEAMGLEGTEIDALASLQPDLLREIAEDAILDYYDPDLDYRVSRAKNELRHEIRTQLNEQTGGELLRRKARAVERCREIEEAAQRRLGEAVQAAVARENQRIDEDLAVLYREINDGLAVDLDAVQWPSGGLIPPRPELPPEPEPLIDSALSWVEQTRRLIASKKYEEGA